MQNRTVILKGSRSDRRMSIFIPKESGMIFKDIPPYFTVEINLGKIKAREMKGALIVQEDIDGIISLLKRVNKPLELKHIKSKVRISFKRTKSILEVLLAHDKIKKVGELYMIK